MPWAIPHASKDWQAFLGDAKDGLGLKSNNMAYTAVQGVLVTFRHRLTPREVMAFADVLPAVLRAVFVAGWNPEMPPALRPHHNLTPPAPIEPVARALRRALRQPDLDRVLAAIGPEAQAFWQVSAPAADLARRIV
mgnify:CR=1 FL=1